MVRDLERVRVFSPTPESRRRFVEACLPPESFIDVGYLKELERSGFIKTLYGE